MKRKRQIEGVNPVTVHLLDERLREAGSHSSVHRKKYIYIEA